MRRCAVPWNRLQPSRYSNTACNLHVRQPGRHSRYEDWVAMQLSGTVARPFDLVGKVHAA